MALLRDRVSFEIVEDSEKVEKKIRKPCIDIALHIRTRPRELHKAFLKRCDLNRLAEYKQILSGWNTDIERAKMTIIMSCFPI